MSQTVDTRVVQMEFDNKEFEKNVKTSMSTLDKLKNNLKFSNVKDDAHNVFQSIVNGLRNVKNAAEDVTFDPIGRSIESAGDHFGLFEQLAIGTLRRVGEHVADAGIDLVKGLSVDNIASGWSKYEQKTNSVATLLAQGFDMDTVNDQLNKLNWYTDETSYNFTDMVSNISKFTASGQTLENSVDAMMGIANWAALSGQNAVTASRAMYQLSQAMSKGALRYDDFKSIQNANMDTIEFRTTAAETAIELGILKKVGEDVYEIVGGKKTDRGSLADLFTSDYLTRSMWLNTDVMMGTFKKYGGAINDLYDACEEGGLTASEAMEELGDKLDAFGLKAFKAAQEARSWTDVVNSVKDAVSTGWMNTFEIIFGDYEKAVKLWSDLANGLYDIFAEPGNKRNEWLEAAFGEQTVVIDAKLWEQMAKTVDMNEDVQKAFIDVGKAHGIAVDEMIKETGGFVQSLEKEWLTIDMINEAVEKGGDNMESLAEYFTRYEKAVKEIWHGVDGKNPYGNNPVRAKLLEAAGYNAEQVQQLVNKYIASGKLSVEDLNTDLIEMETLWEESNGSIEEFRKALEDSGSELSNIIKLASKKSGRDLFMEGWYNVFGGMSSTIQTVGQAIEESFNLYDSEGLYELLENFAEFSKNFTLSEESAQSIYDTLTKIFDIIKDIIDAIKVLFDYVFKIAGAFSSLLDVIGAAGNAIIDLVKTFGNAAKESETMMKVFEDLDELIENLKKHVEDFSASAVNYINSLVTPESLEKFEENVGKVLDSLVNLVSAVMPLLEGAFETILDFVGVIGPLVVDTVTYITDKITGAITYISGFISKTIEVARTSFDEFWHSDILADMMNTLYAMWDINSDWTPDLAPWTTLKIVLTKIAGELDKVLQTGGKIGTVISQWYSIIKKYIKAFLEGISNRALDFWGALGWIITNISVAMSRIGLAILGFIDRLFGLGQAIKDPLNTAAGAVQNVTGSVQNAAGAIQNASTAASNLATNVVNGVGQVKEKLKFADVFKAAVDKIAAGLIYIRDSMREVFSSFTAEDLKDSLGLATILYMFKEVKNPVGEILNQTNTLLASLGNALNGFTNLVNAKALKEIAIAVGILAASMFVVGLIDQDKVVNAFLMIGTAVTAMTIGLRSLLKLDFAKGSWAEMLAMAPIIGIFSTLMLAMAGAMVVISKIPADSFPQVVEGLIVAFGAIYLLMKAYSSTMMGMSGLAALKKDGPATKFNFGVVLMQIAGAMVLVGTATAAIVGAVSKLSEMPLGKLNKGIWALRQIMITMGVFILAIAGVMALFQVLFGSSITTSNDTIDNAAFKTIKKTFKFGEKNPVADSINAMKSMLLPLAAALVGMAGVVAILAKIADKYPKTFDKAITSLTSILTGLASLMAFLALSAGIFRAFGGVGNPFWSFATVFLSMTVLLVAVAGVIALLASLNERANGALKMMAVFALVLGTIFIILAGMQGNFGGASLVKISQVLLLMAATLTTLMAPIVILTVLNRFLGGVNVALAIGELIALVGFLGLVMVALTFLVKVIDKNTFGLSSMLKGVSTLAAVMAAMSLLIVSIAGAITLVSMVLKRNNNVGETVNAIVGVFVALLALAAIIGAFSAIPGGQAIIMMITIVIDALAKLAQAVAIVAAVVLGMGILGSILRDQGIDIAAGAAYIIISMAVAIQESAPYVAEAIFSVIESTLEAIDNHIDTIIEHLVNITFAVVDAVIKSLYNAWPGLLEALDGLIQELWGEQETVEVFKYDISLPNRDAIAKLTSIEAQMRQVLHKDADDDIFTVDEVKDFITAMERANIALYSFKDIMDAGIEIQDFDIDIMQHVNIFENGYEFRGQTYKTYEDALHAYKRFEDIKQRIELDYEVEDSYTFNGVTYGSYADMMQAYTEWQNKQKGIGKLTLRPEEVEVDGEGIAAGTKSNIMDSINSAVNTLRQDGFSLDMTQFASFDFSSMSGTLGEQGNVMGSMLTNGIFTGALDESSTTNWSQMLDNISMTDGEGGNAYAETGNQLGGEFVYNFSEATTNKDNVEILKNHLNTLLAKIQAQFNPDTSESAYKTFFNCGMFLCQGLAQGIEDNSEIVVVAISNLVDKLKTEYEEKTATQSPSRLFMEYGKYVDQGLALGIDKNAFEVTNSIGELATTMVDPLAMALLQASSMIDNMDDYDPVIRPVVDLSDVEASGKALNGMFGDSTFSPSLDASSRASSSMAYNRDSEEVQNGSGTAGATYSFVQNNYSPKALSRMEIYRQTRNQINSLKGVRV